MAYAAFHFLLRLIFGPYPSKGVFSQCGNFMIFLSLRFYVKSLLGILEMQNLPFIIFTRSEFGPFFIFTLFEG